YRLWTRRERRWQVGQLAVRRVGARVSVVPSGARREGAVRVVAYAREEQRGARAQAQRRRRNHQRPADLFDRDLRACIDPVANLRDQEGLTAAVDVLTGGTDRGDGGLRDDDGKQLDTAPTRDPGGRPDLIGCVRHRFKGGGDRPWRLPREQFVHRNLIAHGCLL